MWAEKVDTRSPDHTYWLLVLPSSFCMILKIISYSKLGIDSFKLAKCYRYHIYIIRYIKEQNAIKDEILDICWEWRI